MEAGASGIKVWRECVRMKPFVSFHPKTEVNHATISPFQA
jgi:hypothetical protein